jgi:hypothetical protein
LSLVLYTHSRPVQVATRTSDTDRSGVRLVVELHRIASVEPLRPRCRVIAEAPLAPPSAKPQGYRQVITGTAIAGVFLVWLLLGLIPAGVLAGFGVASRLHCARKRKRPTT